METCRSVSTGLTTKSHSNHNGEVEEEAVVGECVALEPIALDNGSLEMGLPDVEMHRGRVSQYNPPALSEVAWERAASV